MARRSARETALGTVQEMDALAAKWGTEHDAALAQLDALSATLGEDALADPAAAATAPARMQTLRDRAAVADRAVEAAQAKALTARRAVIAAQADECLPGIEKAQAALTAHEERTAVLLAALSDFTGESYTPEFHIPYDSVAVEGMGTLKIPARAFLTVALSVLVKEQACLVAVADDICPSEVVFGVTFAQLPESVRPGHAGCVLSAPGFAAPVDPMPGYRAELADVEQRLVDARALVADIESRGTTAGLGDAQRAIGHLETERDNVRKYVNAGA